MINHPEDVFGSHRHEWDKMAHSMPCGETGKMDFSAKDKIDVFKA